MKGDLDNEQIALSGPRVRLRVMKRSDANALLQAAADGELWNVPFTVVPSAQTIDGYIETALAGHAAGTGLPFVIEIAETGQIVGSTRFWNVDANHRQVELSHVWVAASHQGTFVNRERAYLMLKFAFDDLCCIRVQIRCDEHNAKTRHFYERIGAKREGLIRNERIMPDGRKRNTLLYSVIDEEWPAMKDVLEQRLGLA